ncbi:hypothetical protein H310_03377 [Aphanomyces invadans]|uniref:CS domain-containing protein n=1 Tax=Aphanomyces invadans TaxID=157072 RepID=A0A024UIF2_9STRA|nr:hypothetical protein H310_03377 [Aphanomyces invadans]ETW05652.1 hypothetical protein H310_03377 [Aphanomyces invadans]|eukprot:XP_008865429.1 hypothetical protein H310_03377 [Aphanomyces invadans]
MPSTPRFTVTQDDKMVYVEIRVPYVRVTDMEYHIDGAHFTFWCKPYLLNLTFPDAIVDDDRAKAVYDMNKEHGTITVHLPKETPNAHFPDLDLLTTLLQQKKWRPQDEGLPDSLPNPAPLIEVIGSVGESTEPSPVGVTRSVSPSRANANDSSLLSFEKPKEAMSLHVGPPTYGFNNRFSDFFKCWHGELHEVLSLPTPEASTPAERTTMRRALEDNDFDVERYLLDFANESEDEYFQAAIAYEPFWANLPVYTPPPPPAPTRKVLIADVTDGIANVTIQSDNPTPSNEPSVVFTEKELEALRRLPRREYLPFTSAEAAIVWHGLLDILAAYCYDMRTNQGDPTVESAWTISILSSTLSWLDPAPSTTDIVRNTVRRILTYPFLRQWALSSAAIKDVVAVLRRGKRVVLRVLLAIHAVFESSETYYLLNTLYINDYATWIQSVTDAQTNDWATKLETAHAAFHKADSGWALADIEAVLYENDKESTDESRNDASDDESDDDSTQ